MMSRKENMYQRMQENASEQDVNRKALLSGVLIALVCFLIYLLISAIAATIEGIESLF